MRKVFISVLLLVIALVSLPAKTYVITGDGFHFVCKEAESIENFLVGIVSLESDTDMSQFEQIMIFLDLVSENACTFVLPGSQLHIPDDAEEQELSISGESFTVSSAEIIGEDRIACVIDDDGNCSIVDFSGKVWYPLVLLDQGGAIKLR